MSLPIIHPSRTNHAFVVEPHQQKRPVTDTTNIRSNEQPPEEHHLTRDHHPGNCSPQRFPSLVVNWHVSILEQLYQNATWRRRGSNRLNSRAASAASNIALQSPFQTSKKSLRARDAPKKIRITLKHSCVSMRVRLHVADAVQRRFHQHRAPDCGRDHHTFLGRLRHRLKPRGASHRDLHHSNGPDVKPCEYCSHTKWSTWTDADQPCMAKTNQDSRKCTKCTQQATEKRPPCLISIPPKQARKRLKWGVCTKVSTSNLLTEQTVTSPLLKENQNFQVRHAKVPQVLCASRPMQ